MTTPSERTRAVLFTERFLLDLTNPKVSPRVPKPVRERARMLLRHYPNKFDLEITNEWWNSKIVDCPFGKYPE